MIEDKERLGKILYDLSNGVTKSEFTKSIGQPWMAGVRAECRDLADLLNGSKPKSTNDKQSRLRELIDHPNLNKSEQAILLDIYTNISYILRNWNAYELIRKEPA